jgi:hypothetical protein
MNILQRLGSKLFGGGNSNLDKLAGSGLAGALAPNFQKAINDRVGDSNLGKTAFGAMTGTGGIPMKKGGKVSASSRADGCAVKGKTKGKFV